MELPQFVMTTRAIDYDLNAIEAVVDVRVLGDPQLLTGLTCDGSIEGFNNSIAKFRGILARDLLDLRTQREIINSSAAVSHPGSEPA